MNEFPEVTKEQLLGEGMRVANFIMLWMFSFVLFLTMVFNIPLFAIFIVMLIGSFYATYLWAISHEIEDENND